MVNREWHLTATTCSSMTTERQKHTTTFTKIVALINFTHFITHLFMWSKFISFNNYTNLWTVEVKTSFICKFILWILFFDLVCWSIKMSVVEYEEIVDLPNNPEKLLIDVRDPPEIKDTGSIPTSINIPRKFLFVFLFFFHWLFASLSKFCRKWRKIR